MNRRQLLWTLWSGSVLSFIKTPAQSSTISEVQYSSPISIIIPKTYSRDLPYKKNAQYEYRLAQAVLDFVMDHYENRTVPVWRKKLDSIDIEKRVINIAYWIVRAVEKNSHIYPVDPSWISAQIMAESFFYEFAVSWAFAVGICQFIPRTAKYYGLVTADSTKLDQDLIKRSDLIDELSRFYALSRKRRKLIRKHKKLFVYPEDYLRDTLLALAGQKTIDRPQEYIKIMEQETLLQNKASEARKKYRYFLRANFKDRSIFNQSDLYFLSNFDQRVTYKKPIYAMVQMMAEHLRARNGNILSATAGYNAGLPSTANNEYIYRNYGKIPAYNETTKYLSRIIVNHHEIVKRL